MSHETLGRDAGSSLLCAAAAAAAAGLLCVCGGSSWIPAQDAPGPGRDSTHHGAEQW